VARLLLTGRDRVFSVFPSVGVAAFSAGLAAFGTGLAADSAGESLSAATEGMVTAAGTVTAPGRTGSGEQDQRLTATVTATAANGRVRPDEAWTWAGTGNDKLNVAPSTWTPG
jgi:hypothetical protein